MILLQLIIRNLDFGTTEENLKKQFGSAGSVLSVIIPQSSGQGEGYGLITMKDIECAQVGVEMFNNSIIDGRKVIVEIYRKQHKVIQSQDNENPTIEEVFASNKLNDAEKTVILNRIYQQLIDQPQQYKLELNEDNLYNIQLRLIDLQTASEFALLNILEHQVNVVSISHTQRHCEDSLIPNLLYPLFKLRTFNLGIIQNNEQNEASADIRRIALSTINQFDQLNRQSVQQSFCSAQFAIAHADGIAT
ncbi:MAG: hypothetical protein EZS28_015257, partial [Streblomastix strix]